MEIALLRCSCDESAKNSPTDANCIERRSAIDGLHPRHFQPNPGISSLVKVKTVKVTACFALIPLILFDPRRTKNSTGR
jgi:hypothetical protein